MSREFSSVLVTEEATAFSTRLTLPSPTSDVLISVGAEKLFAEFPGEVKIDVYDEVAEEYVQIGGFTFNGTRRVNNLRQATAGIPPATHWRVHLSNGTPPQRVTVNVEYVP